MWRQMAGLGSQQMCRNASQPLQRACRVRKTSAFTRRGWGELAACKDTSKQGRVLTRGSPTQAAGERSACPPGPVGRLRPPGCPLGRSWQRQPSLSPRRPGPWGSPTVTLGQGGVHIDLTIVLAEHARCIFLFPRPSSHLPSARASNASHRPPFCGKAVQGSVPAPSGQGAGIAATQPRVQLRAIFSSAAGYGPPSTRPGPERRRRGTHHRTERGGRPKQARRGRLRASLIRGFKRACALY